VLALLLRLIVVQPLPGRAAAAAANTLAAVLADAPPGRGTTIFLPVLLSGAL
jgi:hypothetical protein